MTARERVIKTINFDYPDRVPRDLWWLPAVEMTQKEGRDVAKYVQEMKVVSNKNLCRSSSPLLIREI